MNFEAKSDARVPSDNLDEKEWQYKAKECTEILREEAYKRLEVARGIVRSVEDNVFKSTMAERKAALRPPSPDEEEDEELII